MLSYTLITNHSFSGIFEEAVLVQYFNIITLFGQNIQILVLSDKIVVRLQPNFD